MVEGDVVEHSRERAIRLLWLLTMAGICQHVWYWPQLPPTVATHFRVDGSPDDWMSKGNATAVLLGIQVAFPWLLVNLVRFIGVLPNSMINIPYREYWLASDRRSATLAWLGGFLAWIAVATALLMIALAHFTFRANVGSSALENGPFMVFVGAYLVFILGMTGLSFQRFRRPVEKSE
jgi:uncharacterized membrane protein